VIPDTLKVIWEPTVAHEEDGTVTVPVNEEAVPLLGDIVAVVPPIVMPETEKVCGVTVKVTEIVSPKPATSV
jgi:glycine cleavage system H lipoate-binding protein